MTDLSPALEWLPDRLAELMREFQVPGMAVGVLVDGRRLGLTAGVTHVQLGYPVVDRTVFQIGSNTKLLTATAAMRAVDAGLLHVDALVRDYLPTFTLADPQAAAAIRVRHLLTHTSGIDGDYHGPPGLGFADDMLSRFVDGLRGVELLHPPGAMWSYCNAGWVVLGRVLESVFGAPYHQLMHDEVFEPLGMRDTLILPEQILSRSVAMGHLPDLVDSSPRPAPVYLTTPPCAPAGSVPVSTTEDMLRFLQMHLQGGRASDGARFLSEHAVRLMQQPVAAIPPTGHLDAMGLGWMLGRTTGGRRTLGHGGGTVGQISVLEVLPDANLAVVTLSNAYGGGLAGLALMEQVLDVLGGATLPPRPVPPGVPVPLDLAPYAGTYRRTGTTVEVSVVDRELRIVIDEEPLVPEARTAPPIVTVAPIDASLFVNQAGALVRFFEFDERGRPGYLFNFRLLRRVGP